LIQCVSVPGKQKAEMNYLSFTQRKVDVDETLFAFITHGRDDDNGYDDNYDDDSDDDDSNDDSD
jgi:hypothetical protein